MTSITGINARLCRRDRIAANLLLVTCLLPYLSPVPLPFDTQPYAFLVAVVIIGGRISRDALWQMPTAHLLSAVVLMVALASWFAGGMTLVGLRSLFGYASVLVVGVASSLSWRDVRGDLLSYIATTWFVVGAIQRFIFPEFGSQIVARMSTSATRGVTSLAAEPSFYAIVCVLILILNELFFRLRHYDRPTYAYTFAICVLQLFLAASALGFLLLGAFLIGLSLGTARTAKILAGAGMATLAIWGVVWLYLNVPELANTRAGALINQAVNDSLSQVIYGDESVAQRSFAIQASHMSLLYSDGLGFGLGTWGQHISEITAQSGNLLSRYGAQSTDQTRVMSGFGSGIYELGLVGLLLPLGLAIAGRRFFVLTNQSQLKGWAILATITIALVMEGAVPLAFPGYAWILGVLAAPLAQTADASRQRSRIREVIG